MTGPARTVQCGEGTRGDRDVTLQVTDETYVGRCSKDENRLEAAG